MTKIHSFYEARDILLDQVKPTATEHVLLQNCAGRILAQDLIASENIPHFDRSSYDGYAARACDIECASPQKPVTLTILEELPAGAVPQFPVTKGTAAKILTGAPIPEGADVVIPFEFTEFTPDLVTLFTSSKSGANIIRAGEDVAVGQRLANDGDFIDAGLAGTLASQGVILPRVYRLPKIGIICTGNELLEASAPLTPGKIRNSNRHTFEAALLKAGLEPVYLGIAADSEEAIAHLILKGLDACDAILLTGGVSVGDYDATPAAMEMAGAELLIQRIAMKPGMACAYGTKDGKLLCGLSGNPASSLTNFYAVALPALKKLAGRRDHQPAEIYVTLDSDFQKKSRVTRFLRGKLDISSGTAHILLPENQGNVVLSSAIHCDVLAIVPAESDVLAKGTRLKGFLL